jgi:hypothetical protein
MCGDLLLKFLKLYQKFRVLTERLFTDFIQLDITQRFATDNSIAVNRISLGVRYLGGGS